jgi:multisubunit Na+/H+ antiporter MnhB subunit
MLNEKKVMQDKLFAYTMLAVSSGFFLGMASVILLLLFAVNMTPGGGIAAVLLLLISAILAMLADRVYQQLRKFINRPYVGDLEDENEKTDLDTTPD